MANILEVDEEGWAICPVCDNEDINPKRLALGYRTCLECGAKEANIDIIKREKTVIPLGNKQGYGPMSSTSSVEEMRKELLGRTGKGKEFDV